MAIVAESPRHAFPFVGDLIAKIARVSLLKRSAAHTHSLFLSLSHFLSISFSFSFLFTLSLSLLIFPFPFLLFPLLLPLDMSFPTSRV